MGSDFPECLIHQGVLDTSLLSVRVRLTALFGVATFSGNAQQWDENGELGDSWIASPISESKDPSFLQGRFCGALAVCGPRLESGHS